MSVRLPCMWVSTVLGTSCEFCIWVLSDLGQCQVPQCYGSVTPTPAFNPADTVSLILLFHDVMVQFGQCERVLTFSKCVFWGTCGSTGRTIPLNLCKCYHRSHCQQSMNHDNENVEHKCEVRCQYQAQYDNRYYTCKVRNNVSIVST